MEKKGFLNYLIKFISCFCILYYGTQVMIGITNPGGHYYAFADHYLDYISGLRRLLLNASKLLLRAIGYDVYLKNVYSISMKNGVGVRLVYSCLGFGMISFWLAFVFANKTTFGKMFWWMLGGVLIIILMNILRISLLLIAINQHWPSLFHFDNHTWFNIVAYGIIFLMIYLFSRSERKLKPTPTHNKEEIGQ